jgi:hypothetical protein
MKMFLSILLGIIFLLAILFGVYKYSTMDKGRNDFLWNAPAIDRSKHQYSVMTVNVGNSDLACKQYSWKLCRKGVEQRLSENIQKVAPDIITLQEVLAPWQCQQSQETDPGKVCADSPILPQIRRLLGDNYSIVCEPRSEYECFGVRKDIGTIEGCEPGELCYTARSTPPPEGCNTGFSISAVTVKLNNGARFDLVNAHPASFSEECRTKMLIRAFTGDDETPSILENDRILIMGDFNFDPWRTKDSSSRAWQEIFDAGWRGRSYKYHSGIAEIDPPRLTFKFVQLRTLDLVLSNFAEGTCQVLGETPGTSRLDGGSGNDHLAVFGVLEIRP